MRHAARAAVAALFLVIAAAPAGAESVPVQPGPEGEDNSPYQFIPSLVRAENSTAYVFTSRPNAGGSVHSFEYYLKFDVAGLRGQVDYAYVWFYYGFGFDGFGSEDPNPDPAYVDCHNVVAPWTEATLSWSRRPATDVAFYTFPNITGFGHFFCKVDALAQGWVDGSIPNHGLALKAATNRLIGMFTFESLPTIGEVPNGLTPADLRPTLLIRFRETATSDVDGDGVRDRRDNCAARANLDQGDWDGDRRGDACDVCPAVWDRRQRDSDSDGRGDKCGRAVVDLDRNGTVDDADRALAEAAVGARRRAAPWGRRVDTNRDGRVTDEDLARWLSVYEQLR